MKKFIALLLVVAMTATATVGLTLAYLTQDVGNEKNVFSVGNIDISLDEEVGVYGEGGTVVKNQNGADYNDIMPGDYLKKEVTVSNNGETDAYVAVTVTVNNGDKIAAAIDKYYEEKLGESDATDEYIYNMYNNIFDGWGMNYYHDNEYGYDARNTITQGDSYNTDWPEYTLKVDYTETMNNYWLYSKGNWFKSEAEKVHDYWTDGAQVNGDFSLGYYTKNLEEGNEAYTMIYTYYLYLPAGKSSTLFEGLNVPAEFTNEQMKMFAGLEINVEAKAIQADNMAIADEYKNDENGKAKTAFAILAGRDVPEYSNRAYGDVTPGHASATTIWGEGKSNAKESYVVKIYSGDTYMGQTSLNDVDDIIDGTTKNVTWSINLAGESTDYWTMQWEKVPTISMQPTNVELWVDGVKVDEDVVYLNNSGDLIKPAVGAVIDASDTIVKYVFEDDSTAVEDGQTYVPFVNSVDDLKTAITSDGVVPLNSDITLPENLVISSNVTIYGNGHSITSEAGKIITVNGSNVNGYKVTLDGVELVGNGSNIGVYVYGHNNKLNMTNCVISNVKVGIEGYKSDNGNSTYSIGTLKGLTIDATGIGINVYSINAELIEDCTVTAPTALQVATGWEGGYGANASIKDCTLNGNVTLGTRWMGGAANISLTIDNCTINGTMHANVNDGGSGNNVTVTATTGTLTSVKVWDGINYTYTKG